jgi:hypothetical protein
VSHDAILQVPPYHDVQRLIHHRSVGKRRKPSGKRRGTRDINEPADTAKVRISMQALDQFLPRGDLQEGFADEGTKKRQILVGDAAAPAIELLLEGNIFFNHS